MKRKIIGLAKNTNVITLPNAWCEANKLKKGDEIELAENLNTVVVSPIHAEKAAHVDISGKDPMIKRILGALYKGGFTQIHVVYETDDEAAIAEDVIDQEFVGFEIISHDDARRSIVAKAVSDINANDFDAILRRMFLKILQMAEDTQKNLQDSARRKKIAEMDKDVNKLADFCRRAINLNSLRTLNSEYHNNLGLYFIVEQLEKIGDEFRDFALCESLAGAEDMFAETTQYMRQFYDLFYSYNLDGVAVFGKRRYELRDKIDTMTPFTKPLSFCRSIVEKTFDMNGALMLLRNKPEHP